MLHILHKLIMTIILRGHISFKNEKTNFNSNHILIELFVKNLSCNNYFNHTQDIWAKRIKSGYGWPISRTKG